MVREVAHARKRNPLSDLNKILHSGGVPDVITCANFGEDWLRGLGVAGGQSLPFSIDFVRVCDQPFISLYVLATEHHCHWLMPNYAAW